MQTDRELQNYYGESAFDVDPKTGFMPPRTPLERLPAPWETWEILLDAAISEKLRPGDIGGLSSEDEARSARWRDRVRETPIIPTEDMENSPVILRRAHLVLTFLFGFYVQTIPPNEPVLIPKPISIPVLRVSKYVDMPPVVTFADTVLYNWNLKTPPESSDFPPLPTVSNIRSQTLFSSLSDEEGFYLSSARIELRGVEALEIMRTTMDEIFVGDSLAVDRIAKWLKRLAVVINDLRVLLLGVRQECDPEVYYNDVRPWFRGEDSDPLKRKWVFEGLAELQEEGIQAPTELSGASAGQSSLVHSLDCFFGVDNIKSTPDGKPSFMSRMQVYMPKNHRLFLDHLAKTSRPLRAFVEDSKDEGLLAAFNEAVMALKEFRDSHMIIVTLYIIGPARRARALQESQAKVKESEGVLKGTGGTDLVKFLKGVRTQTKETVIETN